MSLETAALDHACNVVRRQIQDEIKDLTLFFIAHGPGGRVKALEAQKPKLFEYTGGAQIYRAFALCKDFQPDTSMFVGFTTAEEKSFLSLFKKKKTVAAFYVNIGDFGHEEDMYQGIYQLAWQALSLIDHYKNNRTDFFIRHEDAVRPHYNTISLARENMLGDAFSAIMLELQDYKGFIHKLARKRCEMALRPITGYRAELYPYPVAADATQIVHDEIMKNIHTKITRTEQAMETTREIGVTYDDNAIRQWMLFSTAAQEMAWLNFNKNKILSTALYTSEDPYVRSTAYIVAETLNMEPAPLTDLGQYNPFTDQEVNERLHNRLCEEKCRNLLPKLNHADDEKLLLEKAAEQNAKLLNGYVIGWCASALYMMHEAFLEALKEDSRPQEQASQAFHAAQKEIPWEEMRKLSHIIMNKKRDNLEITAQLIMDLCQGDETLAPVAEALNWAPPGAKAII